MRQYLLNVEHISQEELDRYGNAYKGGKNQGTWKIGDREFTDISDDYMR
jgi:hypothetical protein